MSRLFNGRYFDGKSAKGYDVQLQLAQQDDALQLIVLSGDAEFFRRPMSAVKLSDPFSEAATRIDLGEDAVIEVRDGAAFWAALESHGYKKTFVQSAQTSWKWAIGSIGALVLVGFLTFQYGIPWAAEKVANSLPESVDAYIGEKAWPSIEQQLLNPSKLPLARQEQLRNRFAELTAQLPNQPKYQLDFRASKVGPNAFAIPGGRIVMTDELVKLAKDDNAIYGVLMHELGHVKQRHSMRNIVQATAATGLISIWLGDVSSLIAIIPGTLATLKYSRDIEREADLFALEAMNTAKIPTKPLADLFAQMEEKSGVDPSIEGLLSSHPVTKERIKLFSK